MPYTAFTGSTGSIGTLNAMLAELFDGVTVGDNVVAHRWKAATGRVRFLPYANATLGALFESVNPAESAYLPLTLRGTNIRFIAPNGLGLIVDASGNALIGTSATIGGATDPLQVQAPAGGNRAAVLRNSAGATIETVGVWNDASSGNNLFMIFATEPTYSGRGSITYNRAGGLVAYNTTSDYRAKDLLGPVADSGAAVDALKVYQGRMKGATLARPMLVAHEVQAVAPYAVTGTKDAVDAAGKPVLQQLDVSALVPLLIAEVQALRARVAALEAAAA